MAAQDDIELATESTLDTSDEEEVLPVGETKKGKLLKPVEAVKIAFLYHHNKGTDLLEGITGEMISNSVPIGTLVYLSQIPTFDFEISDIQHILDPQLLETPLVSEAPAPVETSLSEEDLQHIDDSEDALIATSIISSTLLSQIWQNHRTLKRLGSLIHRHKKLFTGEELAPEERTKLEKELGRELHSKFRLEFEGLPDDINPNDFKAEPIIYPIEKKLRKAIEHTGNRLANVSLEDAAAVGKNILNTVGTTIKVFGKTTIHVLGFLNPFRGGAKLVMDAAENVYDSGHFAYNTREVSKHAWYATKSGLKTIFKIKSENEDPLSQEADAVENAKGRAAIWTFWTQCNVLLQGYFIFKEGSQGADYLSSGITNYGVGNTIQARSDFSMAALHIIISSGFATKAIQELFKDFSHNHDQLESRRAKKVDVALQLAEEEHALAESEQQYHNRILRVRTLKTKLQKRDNGHNEAPPSSNLE
ncbi:MAG: hypothetical protein DHS20C02_02770 [Micavibrio sp.]|nr:MAG: hypothetical protein DHS20C02_02770 [Micavibrio sp.]